MKPATVRSQKYLDWVKTLPSVVTYIRPAGDAHHLKGRGFGGSVKCSDLFTIPLTRIEHSEFHSKGWRTWEIDYAMSQLEKVDETLSRAAHEYPGRDAIAAELEQARAYIRERIIQEREK